MTPQNELKNIMLSQSSEISCNSCTECHCCENQQRIEISTSEFEGIKHLITPEILTRATNEAKGRIMHGMSVYTCPFLNERGQCDIYDHRFIVCAAHGVVNPKEECDTKTGTKGTKIVNPMMTMTKVLKTGSDTLVGHLKYHVDNGKQTDILEAFKRYLKI